MPITDLNAFCYVTEGKINHSVADFFELLVLSPFNSTFLLFLRNNFSNRGFVFSKYQKTPNNYLMILNQSLCNYLSICASLKLTIKSSLVSVNSWVAASKYSTTCLLCTSY